MPNLNQAELEDLVDHPDILDIEAEGPSIAVNFGYVDVDYGDDPDF